MSIAQRVRYYIKHNNRETKKNTENCLSSYRERERYYKVWKATMNEMNRTHLVFPFHSHSIYWYILFLSFHPFNDD